MLRPLLASLLLCSAATVASAATIYKHVDKDGHVTFTNVPMRGARAVLVTPASDDAPPATPRASSPRPASAAAPAHIPRSTAAPSASDAGRRRILHRARQRAARWARSVKPAGRRQKPGTTPAQFSACAARSTASAMCDAEAGLGSAGDGSSTKRHERTKQNNYSALRRQPPISLFAKASTSNVECPP
jgi:hypothetical protein